MERMLKCLLDYQKFSKNKRLAAMIADTEHRYAATLHDDDLNLVNAAGETGTEMPSEKISDGIPKEQL